MSDDSPKTRRLAWWFVAAYCVLIFIGSSIPGREMPEGTPSDKLLHTIEYLILGALVMYAIVSTTRWSLWLALVPAILFGGIYGITDELHQMVTPRRDPSVLDVVADFGGSAIGAAAIALVAFVRRRGSQSRHGDHS